MVKRRRGNAFSHQASLQALHPRNKGKQIMEIKHNTLKIPTGWPRTGLDPGTSEFQVRRPNRWAMPSNIEIQYLLEGRQ